MPLTPNEYHNLEAINPEEREALTSFKEDLQLLATNFPKEPEFQKQLRSFADAITPVMLPISSKNSSEKVGKAITTLNGFQNFLMQEKDGVSNYQRILDENLKGKSNLDKYNLDNCLLILKDRLKLELDLGAIHTSLKNADEIQVDDPRASLAFDNDHEIVHNNILIGNENIIDIVDEEKKPEAVDAEHFLSDVCGKNNFTSLDDRYNKPVKNLMAELRKAKEHFQDIVDHAESTHRNLDSEEVKEARVIADGLKKYYDEIKTLQEYNYNGDKDDLEGIARSINTVHDLSDFLKDGEKRTHFQAIKDAKTKKGTPAVDINKIKRGIDNLENTMHFGMSSEEIENARPKAEINLDGLDDLGFGEPKNEVVKAKSANKKSNNNILIEENKDAVEWLEQWKAKFNDKSIRRENGYPAKQFARIMAARYLAESEIGSADKLYGKKMTLKQIDQKAKELLDNNAYFKDFIEKISMPGKARQTAESCAASGHGGGLDKMFIHFLNKKPAGELENDPLIQRYMPKVKDRIEELQKQAAAKRDRHIMPYTELAEILTLRNMIDAERGEKSSLNKQIPTAKDDVKKLNETVKALAALPNFQRIVEDRVVLERITKGHGGKMIDRMRELNRSDMVNEGQQFFTDDQKAIGYGTYGSRMKANKETAEALKNKITNEYDTMDGNKRHEIRQQVLELIAQQETLVKLSARLEDGLNQNIEWGKVNEQTKKIVENNDFKAAMIPAVGKDNILKALNIVADHEPSQVPEVVAREVGHYKRKLSHEKLEEKNAAKKKPQVQNADNNKIEGAEGNDLEEQVQNFKKNLEKGKFKMG